MIFHPIDMDIWSRKPYFDHYLNNVRCTFSMTATSTLPSYFPS